MKKVLYPGSFDPVTYGHMNIIEQALDIYDKVIVAILVNSSKGKGLFNFEERKALIEKIYEGNDRVEVIAVYGKKAVVDVALENGCTEMVRGLRDITDFADEKNKSDLNLKLSKGKVKTIAFFANPGTVSISSSGVKVVFELGKDIEDFVHPIVKEAIEKKYEEVE